MSGKLDPIAFEVLYSTLRNIVNEVNITVRRTAFSPIITEALDLGAALFDGEGRLVVHGDYDLPVFIGGFEFMCQGVIREFGLDGLEDGDIVVVNDPFICGTHLNDMRFLAPVRFNGELIAFVAACGHLPDVGGMVPGSFAPDATEFYAEGIRIPPVKIYSRGQLVKPIQDFILGNVRVPEERKGDLDALTGGVRRGVQRIKELAEKYGVDILKSFTNEVMAYTERLLRSIISDLPDGEYAWEDFIDQESTTKLSPKKVHLVMRIKEDRLEFDFSGSDPASESASNCTFPSTASAVFVATKCLFPEVQMNHGCFEPVRIIAPTGSIVNVTYPASVSGAAATSYEKVIAVVLGAFSRVVPDRAMACPYNLVNISMGGYDPRPGFERDFVAYTRAEGGHGGRATKDGVTGVISLYGSSSKNSPLEVLERRYPILHTEWSIWEDSGGPGKFRGGCGSIIRFIVQGDHVKLTCLGDRGKFPCFGLFGGKAGAPNRLLVNVGTENEKDIGLRATGYELMRGDEVTILSNGGGGYGNPLERDPRLVLEDTVRGYVSLKGAKENYGVVIETSENALVIDYEATQELRAEIKSREAR